MTGVPGLPKRHSSRDDDIAEEGRDGLDRTAFLPDHPACPAYPALPTDPARTVRRKTEHVGDRVLPAELAIQRAHLGVADERDADDPAHRRRSHALKPFG